MYTALIISQVLSWTVIAVLAVSCLALARQVGVLHQRIAPIGALSRQQGPQAGDMAPVFELSAINGGTLTIGGAAPRQRLLLFIGPNCPVCKQLLPVVRRVAKNENLDLYLATDAGDAEISAMIDRQDLGDLPIVNSRALGLAYVIDKLPHAILISKSGAIVARGLVNTREHLESLIVADELGVASVQEYLRSAPAIQSKPQLQA